MKTIISMSSKDKNTIFGMFFNDVRLRAMSKRVTFRTAMKKKEIKKEKKEKKLRKLGEKNKGSC